MKSFEVTIQGITPYMQHRMDFTGQAFLYGKRIDEMKGCQYDNRLCQGDIGVGQSTSMRLCEFHHDIFDAVTHQLVIRFKKLRGNFDV